MAQLGHRARLRVEAGHDLSRITKMGMNDFDRDFAPEPPVAGSIHGRHPAMPDLVENLVLGELGQPAGAGRGLHCLPVYQSREPRGIESSFCRLDGGGHSGVRVEREAPAYGASSGVARPMSSSW
jgi:hypothetical protein